MTRSPLISVSVSAAAAVLMALAMPASPSTAKSMVPPA